jgi:GntR family transcriptional repressor for pyruvate dehydrogenase complex
MAEEVANLFSAMNDPQAFLVHDIDFHRSVAAASGNPIIAAVMEMISSLYYERRRETATRATQRNLRDAAEMHRRVYQAIRAGNAEAARAAMSEHLTQSSSYQAQEAENDTSTASGILGPPGRTPDSRRKRRTRP